MEKEISIVIIGGGASGTITALHLMRKLNSPAHIYIIEKRKEALFRGNAYSSQLIYEPLNVPAGRMSLFNHLPDDFFYWLKTNKQHDSDLELTRESFISRRWYGDYLTDKINGIARLSSHIRFQTIYDTVNNVDYDARKDAYNISMVTNGNLYANYLVFATGNESPADIFQSNEIAELNEHYISNPWIQNSLKAISKKDDVLIIGTGLTMVDHVISLEKLGHSGKIYCFSRNGYLPLVHTSKIQNVVFEYEDQSDLKSVFSVVRKNIEKYAGKNIEWQNSLDGMRGKTARIWKQMDIKSKELFLKRLRSFWEIHRHRMPLASAEVLNRLVQNGQLEILSGKQRGIQVDGHHVSFTFNSKTNKEERTIFVEKVINCTGPVGDYFRTSNQLICNLLQKGWMKQDELKVGIETGVRGEIIKSNGVVLQNSFAIGPLRKASEWETTAIREIRQQAEETASHISSRIELNHDVMVEIGI